MRNRAPKSRKTNNVSDHVEEIDPCNASSAMDCTGLMPTPPRSDTEAESYKAVYDFAPPEAAGGDH